MNQIKVNFSILPSNNSLEIIKNNNIISIKKINNNNYDTILSDLKMDKGIYNIKFKILSSLSLLQIKFPNLI